MKGSHFISKLGNVFRIPENFFIPETFKKTDEAEVVSVPINKDE